MLRETELPGHRAIDVDPKGGDLRHLCKVHVDRAWNSSEMPGSDLAVPPRTSASSLPDGTQAPVQSIGAREAEVQDLRPDVRGQKKEKVSSGYVRRSSVLRLRT